MDVLVGTDDGLHRLGTNPGVLMPGAEIRGLSRGSKWWALWGDRAVYSSKGGIDWRLTAPVSEGPARCIAATPHGILVGLAEARLAVVGALPVTSFERIEGRDTWYTPWGGPPDTRSISFGTDATLYVNVHVGGIPRSRDGGRTWQPTIDVDTDVHQVLARRSIPGLVLAATAYGLARSEDSGDSWALLMAGLHAPYSRAVAVAGDWLLLTASTGPRGGHAAVYRTALLGNGEFERCRNGLPEWFESNIDTHCLAATGPNVAFGTADGRVFVSSDAGATWEETASGLPPVRCLALL